MAITLTPCPGTFCHCVYPKLEIISEILFWVVPLHHSWFAISCELNWMEDLLVQLSQGSDAVHKQTFDSKKTLTLGGGSKTQRSDWVDVNIL